MYIYFQLFFIPIKYILMCAFFPFPQIQFRGILQGKTDPLSKVMATQKFWQKLKLWGNSWAFSLVVRWRPVAARLVPPHRRGEEGRGGEWNGGLYFLLLLTLGLHWRKMITIPS